MNLTTNRNANSEGQPESTTAAVERILASEERLMPSSGFMSAVMERVREEAAAPAPIPFPWKRIAPGLALLAGTFGWGAWQAARFVGPAVRDLAQNSPQIPATLPPQLERAAWVVLALAVSWASWAFSMRLARRMKT